MYRGCVENDCTPLDVRALTLFATGKTKIVMGVSTGVHRDQYRMRDGRLPGEGIRRCENGVIIDTCDVGDGTPDVDCDGVGVDCDSRIDEGYRRAIVCGIGACEADGQRLCQAGGELEDAVSIGPLRR